MKQRREAVSYTHLDVYKRQEVTSTKQLPDDNELLTKTILEAIENGAEMVLCTGGMSVDPDDKTPLAIKNTGADIISYGAPVLPGAMFLLAYYKKGDQIIPIMGLPGCVRYAKRTVFDLILRRICLLYTSHMGRF